MNTNDLLLLGAGGHAIACIEVIEEEGVWRVGGLLASPAEIGHEILGYPVIGTDEEIGRLASRFRYALVAVGQIASASARARLFEAAVGARFELATVVSPRAHVSRHASLGRGTIVMHGAVVNARAVIGSNCIINSQALVEHGAVIEDHCHVSTGARVNGEVHIGTGSFIGSGAVVRERVSIGRGSVIGMGQLVLADCGEHTNMAGARLA